MNQLSKISISIALCVGLCGGCTSVIFERVDPVPDFFMQFDAGESAINNSFSLNQKLKNTLVQKQKGSKKPVLVMVASGDGQQDYDLAVSRLFSFANASSIDADFRVLVKPLERAEQANRVAIYNIGDWDEFSKSYLESGDFSWVLGSGAVYRSSDKRLFLSSPLKRKIVPAGSNQLEQLGDALSQLGWNIQSSQASLKGVDAIKVGPLNIVTLEPMASKSEITLLVKEYLKEFLPAHDFIVIGEDKVVRVWNNSLYGDGHAFN